VLALPLARHTARTLDLSDDAPLPTAPTAPPEAYYYRSSLCSTPEGRGPCERLEARYVLRPVDTASFPAIPSMNDLLYDASVVHVGLYRIEGRKP
jgi:hypothetical protein